MATSPRKLLIPNLRKLRRDISLFNESAGSYSGTQICVFIFSPPFRLKCGEIASRLFVVLDALPWISAS